MLQNLGYDVLVGNIFPNLSGKDIVNVSLCCKALNNTVTQLVWRSRYRSTFDMGSTNSSLEGDWEKAYAKRLNCKIYCWGDNIRPARGAATCNPYSSGACLPWQINSNIKTRQIELCGFGLLMLDLDGNIWIYGSLSGQEAFHRRRLGEGEDAPVCITEDVNIKFNFISTGRSHVIAVGGENLYSLGGHPRKWKEVSAGNILTVAAGWDISAAINYDTGVLIWKDIATNPEIYTIVPDTKGKGALAAGAGFVLYLDEAFRLHFIDTRDDNIRKQLILEHETPICIRATYVRFAVICESTRTYMGRFEDGKLSFELVENSEEIKFADISLGDHHNIGLSKSGEVYAWGRESRRCGSLGLGLAQNIIGAEQRYMQISDIIIGEPRKVSLTGAVSITAGGWQSAAIVTA